MKISVFTRLLPSVICWVSIVFGQSAYQVSTNINYQGYLSIGGLPFDGQTNFSFEIVTSSGVSIWSESISGLSVNNGVYNYSLAVPPILIYPTNDYLLKVTAAGQTVTPDIQLASVPFAYYAGTVHWSNLTGIPAGFADAVDHSADPVWVGVGSNIYFNDGYVGIGTATPLARLSVSPDAAAASENIGGLDVTYGALVESVSGRSGFSTKVINNWLGDGTDANAGFSFIFPFDGSFDDYKAFRLLRGSTLTDRFYVESDGDAYFAGRVGIGVRSPGHSLDVGSQIRALADGDLFPALHLERINGVTRADQSWSLSVGSVGFLNILDNTYSRQPVTIERNVPDNLLYLDSLGYVGIGIANPVVKLQVSDATVPTVRFERTGAPSFIQFEFGTGEPKIQFDVNNSGRQYTIGIDDSATGDPFVISSGNDFGTGDLVTLSSGGYMGLGVASPQERLSVNGNLRLQNGGTAELVLSMHGTFNQIYSYNGNDLVLNTAGDIGVKVTDPVSDLHVRHLNGGGGGNGITIQNETGNRFCLYTYAGSETLAFYCNGNASPMGYLDSGGFNPPSDRRIKKGISDIPEVLDDVMALRPVSFQYKHTKSQDRYLGFIAQEVDKVFPELTSYFAESDSWGIRPAGLSAVAIRAIQEQQQRIDTLEQQLQELQSRLDGIDR